jgi:hypothetical protein
VAGCCKCGDEPSGSFPTELVISECRVGCMKIPLVTLVDSRRVCSGTFYNVTDIAHVKMKLVLSCSFCRCLKQLGSS